MALLATAREAPGTDVDADIAGLPATRVRSISSDGVEELWLAVSTRDGVGEGVQMRLRDMIFAIAGQLSSRPTGPRADWLGGRLHSRCRRGTAHPT